MHGGWRRGGHILCGEGVECGAVASADEFSSRSVGLRYLRTGPGPLDGSSVVEMP
jgi:hypothetical protein